MIAMRNCPKCGHENDTSARACQRCHASLVVTCPRCGRERPWYVPRCTHCDMQQPPDANAFDDMFRQGSGRTVAGRYTLGPRISSGRVSAVFVARDATEGDRQYAVKELSPIALFRPDERRTLERQFEATIDRWRAVSHPGIPTIVDVLRDRGKYYVVMPYVPGVTIREVIERYHASLGPAVAAAVGAQVCGVLSVLHGLIRPQFLPFLSPSHVLLSTSGQAVILDLGLTSLFLPSEYGAYGSVAGYAAPELKTEAPSVQTDIFALGRVLYAGLVGRLLEQGTARRMPLQRAIPGISSRLVKAIARAAQRDPERRFSSAASFRKELWPEERNAQQTVRDWVLSLETKPIPAAPITAPEQTTATRQQVAAPSQPRTMARASSAGSSMADFGFEPDVRFGGRPSVGSQTTPRSSRSQTMATHPGRLSVHPRHLVIADLGAHEKRRVVLSLHNPGETSVKGRIVSHVGWLSAPSRSFIIPPDKQAKAILTVRGSMLGPGQTVDPQALAVHVGSRRQWIAVTAEVQTGPALAVEPRVIEFGEVEPAGERRLPLRLISRGTQPVSGSVRARVPWLSVSSGTFRCPAGESSEVQVALLSEQVPSGAHAVRDAIVVDSDAGQERVEVRVSVRRSVMELTAGAVDFGGVLENEPAGRRLVIRNRGDADLIGTTSALVPWVRVRPQEIRCSPGESIELVLVANVSGIAPGPLSTPQAVRVETNGGSKTIGASLQVLGPCMQISTSHLSFGTISSERPPDYRLMIQNSGTAPLVAEVEPLLPWITCEGRVVQVMPEEEQPVQVGADVSLFEHGTEARSVPALRISAGSDVRVVTASIVVLRPLLRIEPESLDFGYADPAQPESRVLRIANDGTGTLGWNIVSDAPWVEYSPESGMCGPGEAMDVTLTAYGLALDKGVQSAESTLIVNSDGGRAKVPLTLTVASPRLACDTTFLDLGDSVNYENVSASLRIFNYGLGLLKGTIRSDETWLTTDRVSFECQTGRSVEIVVTTDLAEASLEGHYITGHLRIETNGGNAEVQTGLTIVYEPRVEAKQRQITLKASERDPQPRGRLTLRNSGLAGAHIELLATHPQIALSRSFCDVKPGKSVRINVHWTGPVPESSPEANVIIRAEDETIDTVLVHVSCQEPCASQNEATEPQT